MSEKFMAHAFKLSKDFQLVDNGPPTSKQTKTGKKHRRKHHNEKDDEDGNDGLGGKGGQEGSDGKGRDKSKKCLPVCLWPFHREKGYRHLLMDCLACPKSEKKGIL